MSWSHDKRTPEEEAARDARYPNRPTKGVDSDPENKTGWIAYYSCDRSGGGFERPNYLYLPWANDKDYESIVEHIQHFHESWMIHAERAYLDIHLGVDPPRAEVVKYAGELMESAGNKMKVAARLYKYLNEKDGL